MRLWLDEYAGLDSPLHRWEPRCRLVGLTVLMFAFSFVEDLRLVLPMVALALLLYAASKLPLSFLLTRLRSPGFFVLVVALLLPLLSGRTVILHIGPLALREEGCLELLVLVAKFVSILTTGLVLFGVAPFLDTVKAMRALGLPSLLADITLFSYRYIYQIGDDLRTMETATRLRGFRVRRLGVLASLAATMLVRSYEQSERVSRAMILRGYGRSRAPDCSRPHSRDLTALAVALIVSFGFAAAELLFRQSGG